MRWLASPFLLLLTASAVPQDKIFLVTAFERVRVDGPFTVEIVPGTTRAVASGDARQMERLTIRVDGGTLVVTAGISGAGTQASRAGVGSPKITLKTPALRGLLVNGGGQVRVGEMRGSRVDVTLNGSGSIDVGALQAETLGMTLIGAGRISASGTARTGRVRLSGPGTIDAGGLQIGDATVTSESPGELKIGARYSVRVFALGLGKVTITGLAECKSSGPGPVECGRR